MSRRSRSLLTRFSLLSTRTLSAAREATSQFWPRHTSEVLGPEEYALEMNRVLLGRISLTYVACTSRIRVMPTEPVFDFCLYVPLEGRIEIVADGIQLAASPDRPLLRGPARHCRFEASPTRCLAIDLPATAVAAAAAAVEAPPLRHSSIDGRRAEPLVRLVNRLVAAANRSRSLFSLQRLSARERLAAMPADVERLETSLLAAVVNAVSFHRSDAGGTCDVESLKAWLAGQAHRRVRIGELARRAGVTPRTVERAFLRTGCTPLEYLRCVRLERARRMLAQPTTGMTVRDAAAAAGFTHMGRFATDYRQHFGELPSRTLARHAASR